MKKTFLSSVHERRSIYTITNTSPIPKNKIVALIEMLIEDVPSAFNCQSAQACSIVWPGQSELLGHCDEDLARAGAC